MNIALWILQVLLAMAFAAHGLLYLAPPAEMVEQMNATIPPALRIFIGVAELLAAVGLILPGATRVMPWLVPAAAAGLMVVTLSATVFHAWRAETSAALTTATLLILSSVVAYARWRVRPIRAR